jgi:hypothetical protein
MSHFILTMSHFILTMTHWSSGLPVCFPSLGTQVQIPSGVLMWNRDSPVSVVLATLPNIKPEKNYWTRLPRLDLARVHKKMRKRRLAWCFTLDVLQSDAWEKLEVGELRDKQDRTEIQHSIVKWIDLLEERHETKSITVYFAKVRRWRTCLLCIYLD